MQRAPVLLHKTVMVTFMLDRVLELFPDARFVHLFRDGRAVAASLLLKDRDKREHARYREANLETSPDELLVRYAAHWQAHLLALEEAARRHRWHERGVLHEMSYEGLCADPRRELSALADFMGIAREPFTRRQFDDIKNTNHKSRTTIPAATLARMNEVAATALAAKGYSAEVR